MRTIVPMVLAPVFVLVAMTFALLIMTGRARVKDIAARRVKVSDIALGQSAWPERTQQMGNAFNNQFQLPVLFYVLVAFSLLTGKHDYIFIACQWLFVASRGAHAWVHVTSNNVRRRFDFFLAGVIVLMLMWLWFAIRILAAI